jgi:hypothetical protein
MLRLSNYKPLVVGAAMLGALMVFAMIGRVSAQLVVGTMGGMTSLGGTWIDKDGTTKIGGVMALVPSGNFTEAPVTTNLSGTAATVLNLNPTGRRTSLLIELNTASATIACTDDGSVPVLWTAPAITITAQGSSINYRDIGMVPAGVIKCIAGGTATITVRAS